MPRFPFKIYILIITPLLLTHAYSQKNMKPPVAKKVPKSLVTHGQERIDNYYWLNDREDKKVIKYLKDENKYSDGMMAHTKDFQTSLFNEMVGRIKQTDLSVPYRVRGYWYYNRYEEGKEYPIYCRKQGSMDAKEEIMLNVNEMAKGSSYYDVTGLSISTDNNLLAYGVDNVSRRKYTMYVKNLTTGEIYKETVPNTDGSYVWANDNQTLFYDVKYYETLRTYLILINKL
jgi:oligopeptidase B